MSDHHSTSPIVEHEFDPTAAEVLAVGRDAMDTKQALTRQKAKAAAKKPHRISWKIERAHWHTGKRILVGVDEAGRGPLAGPVVAAAVCFPYELCQKLPKALRALNDSKQVTEPMREMLFDHVIAHASAFGIGVVSAQEIDEINILRATMKAMTLAVEQLATSLANEESSPEVLLIDGNYFRTNLSYEYQTVIDGDAKSPLIAAASILAKVTRDRLMRELDTQYPQYLFAKHKGYGTREHRAAIREHGMCPEHRRSFRGKQVDNELLLFTDIYDEQFLQDAALNDPLSIEPQTTGRDDEPTIRTEAPADEAI